MDNMVFTYKNLFESYTIKAFDDSVTAEFKTLSNEYLYEYKYKDLNSSIITGKMGNPMWSSLSGYLFLACAAYVVLIRIIIPDFFYNPINRILPFSLVIVSSIFFLVKIFIKNECIWIDNKKGETVIFFRLNKNNRNQAEKVKNFIVNKIEEADNGK